jgi:hypothetical protein
MNRPRANPNVALRLLPVKPVSDRQSVCSDDCVGQNTRHYARDRQDSEQPNPAAIGGVRRAEAHLKAFQMIADL